MASCVGAPAVWVVSRPHFASKTLRTSKLGAREMLLSYCRAASSSVTSTDELFPRKKPPRVILGSQSSIRRELLKELGERHGFEITVQRPNIDEKAIRFTDPTELVLALARAKAAALLPGIKANAAEGAVGGPTLLITCDQVVEHMGAIKEKPESEEQARANIEGFSVSPPRTVASIMCTNVETGFTCEGVDTSEVHFAPITEDVVQLLLKDDLTYQCAGGLAVEHPLVTPFVKEIVGSMDSVQGLPQALVERLMREAYHSTNK